jgi:chloramphenicol O-acetyltransferase
LIEIERRIQKNARQAYPLKKENYKSFTVKNLDDKIPYGKFANNKVCDIARIDLLYLKSLKDSHLIKISIDLWIQLEKLSESRLKKLN